MQTFKLYLHFIHAGKYWRHDLVLMVALFLRYNNIVYVCNSNAVVYVNVPIKCLITNCN